MEPDAEFDTFTARDCTCVSPEDRDIWSLSSPEEPGVAHNVDYSCRSYQLLLNRHTLYCVICAGKIIPNLFFL